MKLLYRQDLLPSFAEADCIHIVKQMVAEETHKNQAILIFFIKSRQGDHLEMIKLEALNNSLLRKLPAKPQSYLFSDNRHHTVTGNGRVFGNREARMPTYSTIRATLYRQPPARRTLPRGLGVYSQETDVPQLSILSAFLGYT